MHHDSTAGCSSNGFVMSASRGTKGEVTWSTCSRNVAQSLDKDCLRDNDGGPSEWNHMDKYDNRPGKYRGCTFARFDNPCFQSSLYHYSRVFLSTSIMDCQLWIVNYYIKSSSKNLSNENIKLVFP